MVVPPGNRRDSDLKRTRSVRRKVPRDNLPAKSSGQAGQARPGGARLPTLQHAARRRPGGLPPKGFETRTHSACLRCPQTRKGEKCKPFCLSLSFLVLPPSPPVSPQAGPACCRDRAAAWRLCRLVPKPFGERPLCRIPLHRGWKPLPQEPSADACPSAQLRVPLVPSSSRGACRGIRRSHSVPPLERIFRCAILSVSAPFP